LGQHHLVRQQIDAGRGQRCRVLHQWQRMGLQVQPGVAQALGAAGDIGDDLLGAARGRAQARGRNLPLAT
jgi:hypothetical protein